MTPEQSAKLNAVHDSVIRLETSFLGKGGTLDKVVEIDVRLRYVEEKLNVSGGKVAALVGLAAGSGTMGAVFSNLFHK